MATGFVNTLPQQIALTNLGALQSHSQLLQQMTFRQRLELQSGKVGAGESEDARRTFEGLRTAFEQAREKGNEAKFLGAPPACEKREEFMHDKSAYVRSEDKNGVVTYLSYQLGQRSGTPFLKISDTVAASHDPVSGRYVHSRPNSDAKSGCE